MSIESQADRLAKKLVETKRRVVFAESCTAGLVSARLGQIPGISEYLCGSAVVYREATKRDWLAVSAADLEQHTAVSGPVARQMALAVLERTPEAHLSVSVTGHLGPHAPEDQDGVVFIAAAERKDSRAQIVGVWQHRLQAKGRLQRQQEAAELVLKCLTQVLS